MLKHLKIIVFAAFIVFGASVGAEAADTGKIGLVDYQRVLENSSAGKAAEAQATKMREEMQAELKNMEKELVDLKEKLEREALVMSKETRDEKEREFRLKANDLQFMQKKFTDDLKEKERELIGRIQKDITEIVAEMGKKGGYLMILERRECGAIYFPDSIDMTDKVIEAFNKKTAGGR